MNKQLEAALAEEFPFLKRGLLAREQKERWGVIRDTFSAFGMQVGDGWYQLLYDLCAEITAVYQAEGKPADIVVEQVKEKFGVLRFYYHHESQPIATHGLDGLADGPSLGMGPGESELSRRVSDIVSRYETLSGQVCEICGKPGSRRTHRGNVRTLCQEHDKTLPGERNGG